MKRVVRSFTLFIASSTYVWLLFLTATSIAAFFTLRDSTTIKQWLADSGVYSNVVDEVSKLATIQQKQENSLVQITADDIRLTAQQVFTPDTLQEDMEGVIDGFYNWFKGETTSPEFTVDFAGRQAAFGSAMALKLEQKINDLPECSTTGRFTVQAFDPFKAECRPKDIDLTEELSSFEQELANSKDILPQVKYTGDDVRVHEGTESVRIASAWPWVPKVYKGVLYGPWLVALLTVAAGLLQLFLSSTRRKGARRFAGGLLFTGVILILSGFFLRPAFEKLNDWSTKSLGGQASFTQNVIDPIFKEMNKTYSVYSIYFGIGYTIPALVTYGILLLTRGKHEESVDLQHTSDVVVGHPQSVGTGIVNQEVPVEHTDVEQTPTLSEQPENGRQHTSASHNPPTFQDNNNQQTQSRGNRVVTRRPPMIQG